MKEKIQAYRPAAAAFLTMMAMSLTSSILSFFLEPICSALEISRGSFSLVFSLMSVSGALMNPFIGQYAGAFCWSAAFGQAAVCSCCPWSAISGCCI